MDRSDHDPFAPIDGLDTSEPITVEGDGIKKTGIDIPPDGELHTVELGNKEITASVKVHKPTAKPKAPRRKPAAKSKAAQHA